MTSALIPAPCVREALDAETRRIVGAVAEATGMDVADWRSSGLIIATPHVDVQPDGTGGIRMTVIELRIETLREGIVNAPRLAEILEMRVALDTGYTVRLLRGE